MPAQNDTTASIVAGLRDAASELRKMASLLDNEPTTSYEELDPEKVRDFLVFFGGKI